MRGDLRSKHAGLLFACLVFIACLTGYVLGGNTSAPVQPAPRPAQQNAPASVQPSAQRVPSASQVAPQKTPASAQPSTFRGGAASPSSTTKTGNPTVAPSNSSALMRKGGASNITSPNAGSAGTAAKSSPQTIGGSPNTSNTSNITKSAVSSDRSNPPAKASSGQAATQNKSQPSGSGAPGGEGKIMYFMAEPSSSSPAAGKTSATPASTNTANATQSKSGDIGTKTSGGVKPSGQVAPVVAAPESNQSIQPAKPASPTTVKEAPIVGSSSVSQPPPSRDAPVGESKSTVVASPEPSPLAQAVPVSAATETRRESVTNPGSTQSPKQDSISDRSVSPNAQATPADQSVKATSARADKKNAPESAAEPVSSSASAPVEKSQSAVSNSPVATASAQSDQSPALSTVNPAADSPAPRSSGPPQTLSATAEGAPSTLDHSSVTSLGGTSGSGLSAASYHGFLSSYSQFTMAQWAMSVSPSGRRLRNNFLGDYPWWDQHGDEDREYDDPKMELIRQSFSGLILFGAVLREANESSVMTDYGPLAARRKTDQRQRGFVR